jgi:peroxiredoxin
MCKKEAPELQKAYLSYKDKEVFFLGVFVMSKDEDIRKFTETYKITFPVGKDNGISSTLGVRGIPVTVFISKEKRVAKRFIGDIDYAELSGNIEDLLK